MNFHDKKTQRLMAIVIILVIIAMVAKSKTYT